MNKTAFITTFLEDRKKRFRERTLRPISWRKGIEVHIDGRTLIDFSSNNSLGLADHPLLKERAARYIHLYGTGAAASKLVSGHYAMHQELETKLAQQLGVQASLFFNSGYQANSTLLPALADRNTLILMDRECHQSLIQGAIASRAHIQRFRHNDMADLRRLLAAVKKQNYSRLWIVSESLFSMSGDKADIEALIAHSQEFNALLYIDDAHAFGTAGVNGMGLCAGRPGIDIIMGGFAKAGGAAGAYAACSQDMHRYLINSCPGIIYSTALAPPILGAIDALVEILPGCTDLRAQLETNANYLRQAFRASNFDIGASNSHIIPLMAESEQHAISISQHLEKAGVLALAIRPPSVRKSLIRFSVSALHRQEHLDQVIEGLACAYRTNR